MAWCDAGLGTGVLPAWVEPSPRSLLRALGLGLPVVASTACGLTGLPGVADVPTGDAAALRDALARHVRDRACGA